MRMSATNNLTSLGLYIAYSAAMRLSSSSTDELGLPQVKELVKAIQHALVGSLTQEEGKRLLKAASSLFFFLYLMSAYTHGSKTKQALSNDLQTIKLQITQLNQKLQDLSLIEQKKSKKK
jgi:hypothetical protein